MSWFCLHSDGFQADARLSPSVVAAYDLRGDSELKLNDKSTSEGSPMPGPMIVIAGSADPKRSDYDPPVDTAGAVAAAEQIGAELATAGCRILVYTSDPAFIDAHLVRGFVSARQRRARAGP